MGCVNTVGDEIFNPLENTTLFCEIKIGRTRMNNLPYVDILTYWKKDQSFLVNKIVLEVFLGSCHGL